MSIAAGAKGETEMTCKDCFHYNACLQCHSPSVGWSENDGQGCKCFTSISEWVHLPCKCGDKIFMIVRDIESRTAFVDEGKVISVTYEHTGVWIYARYERGVSYHHKFGCGDCFFTIAEAEKALKDRKKEDEGK